MNKISLGISPCPNDTFAFYALLHGKVDFDIDVDLYMEDIAVLNQWALEGKLDVTKISFNAFGKVLDSYKLLDSGSALGEACGPLLIANRAVDINDNNLSCIIPGIHTTANLLLSILYPNITDKEEQLFSDIESSLIERKSDLGLIIHESRFTYEEKGLIKISDLGEEWERTTGLPIPLGGIVAHNRLDQTIRNRIDQAILDSILYAYEHESEVLAYCKQFAQEMDETVMLSHIELYVNAYTKSLGIKGREAISFLLSKMNDLGIINKIPTTIFN